MAETTEPEQLKELLKAVKLSGRIDALIRLRKWLERELTEAEAENDRLLKGE